MERTEFKCVMTHEQVLRQKKTDAFIFHVVLPVFGVVTLGILGYLVCLNYAELRSTPDWRESEFLIPMIVLSCVIVFVLCLIVYLARVVVVMSRISDKVYELIETKQFAWDPVTNEFIYSDKDRNLRFKGDDVDKWVSVSSKGATTDIMRLRNGEQFVLEGKFNPAVYGFLHDHQREMHLPQPKLMTLTVNCYEDPI
ncbi:MAG: hypothetical protein II540_03250 [Paludibacteraceae bacterium]|nr:hypothetical protein [Paludibacteraceae bacterium]